MDVDKGKQKQQSSSDVKQEDNPLDGDLNEELDYTMVKIKRESDSEEDLSGSYLPGDVKVPEAEGPKLFGHIKDESSEDGHETNYLSICIKKESLTEDEGNPLQLNIQTVTWSADAEEGSVWEGAKNSSSAQETKTFNCDGCKKSFGSSSDLLKHQLVYKGPHSLICLECGKCFAKKAQLVKHQRIHTRPKPFTCPECKKSFPLKSLLITHQRVHTGEKPYSCGDCDKCFA